MNQIIAAVNNGTTLVKQGKNIKVTIKRRRFK
jgi:hypothetical protein